MSSTAMTLYGSNLWNLFSKDCERIYTAYNVALRNILKIDRRTHRFLLEPLSESLHLQTILLSKFVTFHNTLITSKKFPVRFLARVLENDLRSVHGQNLSKIALLCGVNSTEFHKLKPGLVKMKVKYRPNAADQDWKVELCKELLNLRDGNGIELPGFSAEEQKEILDHVCAF